MLIAHALLSAGDFWSLQDKFEKIPGILATQVGYTGGHTPNPHYLDVMSGKNGHLQAVEITFDKETIDYEKILDHFIDFYLLNQELPHSTIFYFNNEQKIAAKNKISMKKQPSIKLRSASEFYPAEAHHQHYITKSGQNSCCLTNEC